MADTAPLALLSNAKRCEPAPGCEGSGERRTPRAAAPELTRATRENVGQLLALLVIVIALQIYTLALSSVMKNVDALGHDFHAAEESLRQVVAAKLADDSAVFQASWSQYGALQRRYQASQAILARLAVWHWILAPSADDLSTIVKDGPDQAAMLAAIEELSSDQGGRIMLQALALYLLPMLYGLLGANAFVLRALAKPIKTMPPALHQCRLRLALGALLGATVGLFFSADTPIAGMSLSLVAVAFLAGYSVEFFFALFDFLIAKARDSFQPGEPTKNERMPSPKSPLAVASNG